VEDLEGLVQHAEGAVAFRAVQALARLGALSDEVLRRAVTHADPEVVKTALLAGAASAVGVELAVGLLGHAGWDVRAAAARVLGDSGGPECLPATRAALVAETDALTRRALVDAVERLSSR
jgi:HEAT repeat protein